MDYFIRIKRAITSIIILLLLGNAFNESILVIDTILLCYPKNNRMALFFLTNY